MFNRIRTRYASLVEYSAQGRYYEAMENRHAGAPLDSVLTDHWSAMRCLIRDEIGSLICRWFGHSKHVEVEDFVACERDERGRITDIDGGGVDWYCPRCGQGGRSWF